MKGKTNFFKIFITSIYDINTFSKYAKEGLIKGIIYILIVCSGLGILKSGVLGFRVIRGIFSITEYLQLNEDSISIKDGLLVTNSNIMNIDSYIYLDNQKTIDEDIELKNIFNDNKDLLILKDGIAFNNYGNIYTLNYNQIFRESDIDSNMIINSKNKFSVFIMIGLILINLIEILKSLLINYIIIVTAALLVSMFMRMLVKYKALWLLVIYSSTLPLITITILNILKPNVNFDLTFIGGTLTYVILILKNIKKQIIDNLSKQKL